MPASMIRAPTGGSPKVMGSSMAMVATVPIPGKTPTSVPTSAPRRQNRTFIGRGTTPNNQYTDWKRTTPMPCPRGERSSLMTCLLHSGNARPELEGQTKQNDEQEPAEGGHGSCCDEALDPAHLRRAHDGDHEGQE